MCGELYLQILNLLVEVLKSFRYDSLPKISAENNLISEFNFNFIFIPFFRIGPKIFRFVYFVFL